MTRNAWLAYGVLLVAAAAWLVDAQQLSRRASSYERDSLGVDALLAGRLALEVNVLEARAGLQLSFDPLNRALSVLRTAAGEAEALRARGAVYSAAAAQLELAAAALTREEDALEQFKTDLALLRLASRQFPLALGAELDALSGHSRTILDRRERVDRFARALVRSPVRRHLEAARLDYERAVRAHAHKLGALRLLAGALALCGVCVLAGVALRAARGMSPRRRFDP